MRFWGGSCRELEYTTSNLVSVLQETINENRYGFGRECARSAWWECFCEGRKTGRQKQKQIGGDMGHDRLRHIIKMFE